MSDIETYIALKAIKRIKNKEVALHIGIAESTLSRFEKEREKGQVISQDKIRKYKEFIRNYPVKSI